MSIHENSDVRVPINQDSLSIQRNNDKCVLCGACRSTCKFNQGVYGEYDLKKTGDRAICIECGQCANICPSGAIGEVCDYQKLKELMKDSSKVFVFQTAPAIRVSLGEEYSLQAGKNVEGKIVIALKKLGANYVFDTTFGADLTILEEAYELISRLKKKEHLPMFTSCCPAWIKFAELFYPELIPNISTVKSPISMQGTIIKTYFSKIKGINPDNIINIAVTPCTAKKYEIRRKEMNNSGRYLKNEKIRDMDYVITVRELATWLKEEGIDFVNLEETKYDNLLGRGSGAGLIFGTTGGVMEAALRTAHYFLTGKTNDILLTFQPVRGLDGIKEAEIVIGDNKLKLAVVNGTKNVRKLIQMIKENQLHYDFIEVMACLGGCIGGGGQPKVDSMLTNEIKENRMQGLYQLDAKANFRNSFENPEIKALYHDFLEKPGSQKARELLHTSYQSKKHLLDVSREAVPSS